MSIEDRAIRENRLSAVLHKIYVFREMFSNHLPTADEIHDRNTLDMCQVLVDRIAELEAQVDLILNAEFDWLDGPLMVRDLGAVQQALQDKP